ncbi:MAG: hypothetical protein FWH21_06510 [Kiritimatiellaeota bacterium]|nr:hypothetical protein [Kiritimatiellota bacterium]
MKRIAVLSNAIPDAWLTPCGVETVRQFDYTRYTPVPLRAGMCDHLAYLPALLEDVDGIVLTTSCDQMRRGAEWLGDSARTFLFDLPATPDSALLDIEKARLARWVERMTSRDCSPNRPQKTMPSDFGEPAWSAFNIGIIGGHFCGDVALVHRFFERHGIGIRLWGCEGGEDVGDICQRPNDLFYIRLTQLIEERNLDGLVVVRTTWCDLWRAAFARIREVVPVPVTEWVTDGQRTGQPFPDTRSATCLEAFCEMLNRPTVSLPLP